MMYNHPKHHEPSEAPVLDCPECDKEVNRPIKLRFGLGSSDIVIPPPKDPVNE
jgi:hypothetical protein